MRICVNRESLDNLAGIESPYLFTLHKESQQEKSRDNMLVYCWGGAIVLSDMDSLKWGPLVKGFVAALILCGCCLIE